MRLSLILVVLSFMLPAATHADELVLKKGETTILEPENNAPLTALELSWKSTAVPMPGQEKPLWKIIFGDHDEFTLTTSVGCEPADRFDPRIYLRFTAATDNGRTTVTDCRFFGNRRNLNARDSHRISIAETGGGMFDISVDNSSPMTRVGELPAERRLTFSAIEKVRVTDVSITRRKPEHQPETICFATLDSLLTAAHDSISGTFAYLDRQNDPRMAEPGGFYNLALVRDGNEYLIVYLGGAKVEADTWRPGMIKGRLRPTQFQSNYDLDWIDARHVPMAGEQFAVIDDNMILELHFPLYETVMRFSRVPTRSVWQGGNR